jgi:transglutaminase-like putative cysteine protease
VAAPEPARRVGNRREWRVSVALLVVVLVLLAGLHVFLQGAAWWFGLVLLVVVLLGVAALVRYLSRRRFLAPIASAIALLLVMTDVFAPGTAFVGLVPTADTWTAWGRIADAAALSINRQSLPAVVDTPIMFVLCLGVGAIVIVADALAISFRAPAFAGIPLLVLLAAPSVVSIDTTDPVLFVLAALAFLLLLRAGSDRPQTRFSLAMAGTVIVGTLVLPLLLPPTSPAEGGSTGFGTGVNPVLSLGDDLRRATEHTVLDYSSQSGAPHYLRLVSIEDFSGSDWGPSAFQLNTRNTPAKIGSPPGLARDVVTTRDTTNLQIKNLTSPWLPIPYPSTSVVGLVGNWYWDSAGLTVKSTNGTAQGEVYRASSLTISPTPAQLEAAGTSVPGGFERYLALPIDLPKIISSTANEVAGGAASNYEKALLLQSYFHDGNFEYSETAPVYKGYDGTGMKVIAQFLTAKSGYCIHFASAMAVMARSLGIPSRVAVGFLPGTQLDQPVNGQTAFQVGSHDLHAWPELYFEGIGWTRFEPTVGRGTVPSYADQNAAGVPIPVNTPNPVPSGAATPAPSTSGGPVRGDTTNPLGAGASASSALAGWLWALLVVVVVILGLLVPAFVRLTQRRVRLRDLRRGTATPLAAWREVLQTAEDLDQDVPDTATPREVRLLLGDGVFAEDVALSRLIDAVERESYSPGASVYPEAEADTRTIVRTLRSIAARPERVRAVLSPPSIWALVLGPFSRVG